MSAPAERQDFVSEPVPMLLDGEGHPANTMNGAGEKDLLIQSPDQATTPVHDSNVTKAAVPNGAGADESISPGPVKVPFPTPLPESKCDPASQLTPEQQAKYEGFLGTVRSWSTIPTTSAKNSPTAPLSDDEKMWLTRDCLLRYLRAVKWNVTEAPKRLQATLVWRREYGVSKLTADYISPENETGKQVILGYDIKARPCLYLIPSRQNTKKGERQIQHLVFMLERVIDLMVPGQESLSLLINFSDSSSGEIPSVSQGRQVLHILQSHYPERLGRAYVINLPWFVNGFFKFISPFIDPLTREKLKFNEDLRSHVPPTQLLTSMGGDVEFAYEHATYWPALVKLTESRRAAQEVRWTEGGKQIGESEDYLRGSSAGTVPSAESMASTSTSPTTAVGTD